MKGFFVDGAWNGMVQGLTSLVGFSWTGPDGIGFSWSTMGHAWLGVAHLVTMPGPLTMLLMPVLPKPIRDWENESEKTGVQMLAGMVGIDPYAKDPLAAWHQDAARTGGATAFNIFSFLVPETKAGTAGKAGRAGEAGEVAAKASRASRVLILTADGVSWLKGVTLDGLNKIGTKFGVDLSKAFKLSDDATIPRIGRDELDTSHGNVGGHDHTDAPPARDGDRPGTHPANPADPQTHPNVGADSNGAHHEPGTHSDAAHPVDASGRHHGGSDQTLIGTTSSHTIAGDANKFAHDVDARAEKSIEHTKHMRARDKLAHQMGVEPKDLTVRKRASTIRRLVKNATSPAELQSIRELEDAAKNTQVTSRQLNRMSENLGTSAARDYLKSRGDAVIVGDHSLPGKPGTLDNIGLSPDHSKLTVIEAKGGDGSRLGTRMVDGVRVPQGSTTYLNDLLHRDPELNQYLQNHLDLASSIADGKTRIAYEMVKSRNNGRIQVTTFILSLSDLHLEDLLDRLPVGGSK